MTKKDIINRFRQKDLKKIFKENNIKHLYLIGSFSRGEEKNNSDIDLVYEQIDNNNYTILNLIKLKNILEKKIKKKVDLVENDSINKHYKSFIENDKEIIF